MPIRSSKISIETYLNTFYQPRPTLDQNTKKINHQKYIITSNKKKHVFLIRSAKFRERIEAAVAAAQRAAKIAMQKEDIGISR